jgi:hypothetical protein
MRTHRIHRYGPPALADLRSVAVGVVLVAVLAGCGGSSSASSSNPAQNATSGAPPPRVALRTPEGAVRSYVEGVKTVNGGAICNALDEGLRQKIIKEIVRARPLEARSSCSQALAGLVRAGSSPSERNAKLPTFHVKTAGNRAVVKYVGTYTHHPHTFTLVKQGPGWLIDKISESG